MIAFLSILFSTCACLWLVQQYGITVLLLGPFVWGLCLVPSTAVALLADSIFNRWSNK